MAEYVVCRNRFGWQFSLEASAGQGVPGAVSRDNRSRARTDDGYPG